MKTISLFDNAVKSVGGYAVVPLEIEVSNCLYTKPKLKTLSGNTISFRYSGKEDEINVEIPLEYMTFGVDISIKTRKLRRHGLPYVTCGTGGLLLGSGAIQISGASFLNSSTITVISGWSGVLTSGQITLYST